MTEKRFIGSYAGFYDKYKENRLLWSEWEEITTILNNLNEKSVERSKALSKLQKENDKLKQEYNKLMHRHSLLHDVCIEAECDRDMYHKDVLSLEKENERLKKDNQKYQKLNGDVE